MQITIINIFIKQYKGILCPILYRIVIKYVTFRIYNFVAQMLNIIHLASQNLATVAFGVNFENIDISITISFKTF